MPTYSQNGYPAIFSRDSPDLYEWRLPGCRRDFLLLPDATGFLLANLALWFHTSIERLDVGGQDDWGWSYRTISGSGGTVSNHGSGTAVDLNSLLHPYGRSLTFPMQERAKIRARLATYGGAIRWGGDYRSTPDDMHFEIDADYAFCLRAARAHRWTPRGRRVMRANPRMRNLSRLR